MDKVKWHDGAKFDDTAHKSVKRYESSDHAHRDFCPSCGASILWSSTKEPDTIDIAAGILRAEDGALARSWLKWRTESISCRQEALDEVFVATVEQNFAKLDSI